MDFNKELLEALRNMKYPKSKTEIIRYVEKEKNNISEASNIELDELDDKIYFNFKELNEDLQTK